MKDAAIPISIALAAGGFLSSAEFGGALGGESLSRCSRLCEVRRTLLAVASLYIQRRFQQRIDVRHLAHPWRVVALAIFAMVANPLLIPIASAVTAQCTGVVAAGMTINCEPGDQAYTSIVVPARVETLTVTAAGGGGGGNALDAGVARGGHGASVTAAIPVTPGQVLKVYVATGGGPGLGNTGNTGGSGYGAGGNGGPFYGEGFGGGYGGGGGGSTALLINDTVTVVAGGGGGGGGDNYPTGFHWGGAGGLPIGSGGSGDSCARAGGGGNADGAGSAGSRSGTGQTVAATSGLQGRGGSGTYGAGGSTSGGGGGGGGYGGGGPGNWNGPYGCSNAGGGGGGGSYVTSAARSVTWASASNGAQTAVAGGNGSMSITFVAAAPTVPGTPQSIAFTDRAESAMTVNWSPPADDGGSAITGYVLTMTPGSGAAASTTETITSPVFQASNLTASTTYAFSIRALNTVGSSATALTGSESTTAALSVPPAPTNLVFETITSSSISMRWTAPADSSTVTGYKVRVDAGGLTAVLAAGPLTFAVSPLGPGTQHTFKVYAENGAGLSVPLIGVETTTTTVPGQVRNPHVESALTTSSSLSVTWVAPQSDGGLPILEYLVSIDSRTAVSIWNQTFAYTATGLTSNSTHTFALVARNANGRSDTVTVTGQTLVASPAVRASNGIKGSPVSIVLTNFTPSSSESMTVLAPSGVSQQRTVTMNSSGAVTEAFTPTETGTYHVTLAPTAASGFFVVDAPPATITVPAVEKGSPFTITLVNYTANLTETLTVTSPSSETKTAQVAIDGNGSGTASFTLNDAGSFLVTSSPTAASRTFTVSNPTPPTPAPAPSGGGGSGGGGGAAALPTGGGGGAPTPPVQTDTVLPLSPATCVAGTSVKVLGTFNRTITQVSINGVARAATEWTQTATSLLIQLPADALGALRIELLNGATPDLPAVLCEGSRAVLPTETATVTVETNTTTENSATHSGSNTALTCPSSSSVINVYFSLNSSTLSAAQRSRLNAFISPACRYLVTGFIGTAGSASRQSTLAAARARNVSKVLLVGKAAVQWRTAKASPAVCASARSGCVVVRRAKQT